MSQVSQKEELVAEIRRLKGEQNAVILAHNYQRPEVQDIADFTGDSLGLSRQAADTKSDVIVFCGVHFMAETAAILSPEKRVLLPDPAAGCSLADTITARQLRAWKAEHPAAAVVSYVNTTAEVKAESDYCCTSSNAVQVVQSIPEEKEILFLPDMFLGSYIERMTGRKLHVWMGECHVHAGIEPENITEVQQTHPDAELLVHPECGCSTSTLYHIATGDLDGARPSILSTGGMLKHARQSPKDQFIVATETGILDRLQKENPGKEFVPANREAVCGFMKKITLEKVYRSLAEGVHEVTVPTAIAERARRAIDRMLAIA